MLALAAVACLLPLFVTPVLPFVDFYAHIVRYQVLSHIGEVPNFAANYDANWMLLPNLGFDLIGTGLMALMPPMAAAKLIAATMILAPLAGMAVLSWALHGRVGLPAILGGMILAYSHILIWGFANFLLGLGMALAGLGLWIALADRPRWQFAVALPFALALFFVHGLVFAIWGLLLGCVELMLAHERGDLRLLRRMARLASLAVMPALLFTQMPTAGAEGGVTPALSNLQLVSAEGRLWPRIAEEIVSRIDVMLRVAESGWLWLDRALGVALWGGLGWAFWTGVLRLDRRLWLAAGLAVLLMAAMPPSMFGVGYLNDRTPLILAALLLAGATAAGPRAHAALTALAALAALRLALVGAAWAQDGAVYRGYLDALAVHDTGPLGASLFLDQTDVRDPPATRCKPLPFLMLLENETAVNTFSFATQQPIALDGALANLAARKGGRNGANAHDRDGVAALAELVALGHGVGLSALVVCTDDGISPAAPPGYAIAAAAAPWTLYLSSE